MVELTWYYNYISLTDTDFTNPEKEIYVDTIMRFLNVRGTAYPQHYKLIAMELFTRINKLLRMKGFEIKDYFFTIEEIESQINSNFKDPMEKVMAEHQRFIEFSDRKLKKGKDRIEVFELYLKESEERRTKLQQKVKKSHERMLKGSFEFEINDKINDVLVNMLSMEFGENKHWNSPMDMSDIAIKPIIEVEDKYYCFLTPHLIRNVIPIIELNLSPKEKKSINYSDIKGKYFEEKTLSLIKQVLPKAQIYSELNYANGEIDGIIINDKTILLIEVKGKKKRIIAGRENILNLTKEDFKAQINEAFDQSKKALKYIKDNKNALFKDKNKKEILKIKSSDFEDIFLINVSLESFSDLSLDLNLVKAWDSDLLKGKVFPWIVNIYDLLVVCDLIEKPNHFLDYIKQRIEINKRNKIRSADELDYLGYYFEHGSLTQAKDFKNLNNPLIHGYSEAIDRWYSFKNGEIKFAEKPKMK